MNDKEMAQGKLLNDILREARSNWNTLQEVTNTLVEIQEAQGPLGDVPQELQTVQTVLHEVKTKQDTLLKNQEVITFNQEVLQEAITKLAKMIQTAHRASHTQLQNMNSDREFDLEMVRSDIQEAREELGNNSRY